MTEITAKGKWILEENKTLSLNDVDNNSDYLSFYKEENKIPQENLQLASASPQDLIDTWVITIENEVKLDLLERLLKIDPYYFEKVILRLLNKMWYGDMIETSKSGDEGIDGMINEDKLWLDVIYIQAKRRQWQVSRPEVQKFVWALAGKKAKKWVFVTTSKFSSDAKSYASQMEMKIILIDWEKLVDLMHQYGVGVQVKNTYEIKEIDEDFFESNY